MSVLISIENWSLRRCSATHTLIICVCTTTLHPPPSHLPFSPSTLTPHTLTPYHNTPCMSTMGGRLVSGLNISAHCFKDFDWSAFKWYRPIISSASANMSLHLAPIVTPRVLVTGGTNPRREVEVADFIGPAVLYVN